MNLTKIALTFTLALGAGSAFASGGGAPVCEAYGEGASIVYGQGAGSNLAVARQEAEYDVMQQLEIARGNCEIQNKVFNACPMESWDRGGSVERPGDRFVVEAYVRYTCRSAD